MAPTEADTKTDSKAPVLVGAPVGVAPAVPASSGTTPSTAADEGILWAVQNPTWRAVILTIAFCFLFFALVGFAYADVFPASLVRPFFFGTPRSLTTANWDERTSGKTLFIKFYAPWCGHCKRIAPVWDKLAAQHDNHSFIEIAEVDCTGTGQSLCQELGVSGYPTLKYGDPFNLQDYKGGRALDDLVKFASELQPTCGPDQLESCSEEQKKLIEEFIARSADKREADIFEQEAKADRLKADFKKYTDSLTAEYKEATAKKEEEVKNVNDGGLAMLKAVIAHEASGKTEEPTKDRTAEL